MDNGPDGHQLKVPGVQPQGQRSHPHRWPPAVMSMPTHHNFARPLAHAQRTTVPSKPPRQPFRTRSPSPKLAGGKDTIQIEESGFPGGGVRSGSPRVSPHSKVTRGPLGSLVFRELVEEVFIQVNPDVFLSKTDQLRCGWHVERPPEDGDLRPPGTGGLQRTFLFPLPFAFPGSDPHIFFSRFQGTDKDPAGASIRHLLPDTENSAIWKSAYLTMNGSRHFRDVNHQ